MLKTKKADLPIPANEMGRIYKLAELDIDYSDMRDNLKDLTKLAAKVAGTEVSLINLIDTFTQWTISNYGLPLEQMPREDSVCQYTIVAKESFEVNNLAEDDRFKDKFYVAGSPCCAIIFGYRLKPMMVLKLGHSVSWTKSARRSVLKK